MEHKGSLPEDNGQHIYSVSALTEKIKDLLEEHFDFVWVEGEISNLRVPSSGHYYMVLKDEKAQIRAVMFRPHTRYLKFMLEDGMKVIVQGRVGVYQPRGEYQVILDYIEPLGVGALALAFEQLKEKLAAQGVFDRDLKRPLPYLPQKVAVITSPTGAAIRDFLKVIQRRFANIEIIVLPVKVQGEEAASEIVDALETVNRNLDVDIIILTRGGGSMEDLWAFNEEALALAIRASEVPVVSAVGHEIDVTISDLAADVRAPTPSAAAELIVAEKEALKDRLRGLRERIQLAVRSHLGRINQHLAFLSRGLKDPRKEIEETWLRLDELHQRLHVATAKGFKAFHERLFSEYRALLLNAPALRIQSSRQRLIFYQHSLLTMTTKKIKDLGAVVALNREKLTALNPLSVLKRGYSITRKLPDLEVLRSAGRVRRGDRVHVMLEEGHLECRVEGLSLKRSPS